jgi:hypothetical protein
VPPALGIAARRRSPATMPGTIVGTGRNKGLRYPADAPRVEVIVAVVPHHADTVHGTRTKARLWCLGAGRRGGLDRPDTQSTRHLGDNSPTAHPAPAAGGSAPAGSNR